MSTIQLKDKTVGTPLTDQSEITHRLVPVVKTVSIWVPIREHLGLDPFTQQQVKFGTTTYTISEPARKNPRQRYTEGRAKRATHPNTGHFGLATADQMDLVPVGFYVGPHVLSGDQGGVGDQGVKTNTPYMLDTHTRSLAWYERLTNNFVHTNSKCVMEIPTEVEYRIKLTTTVEQLEADYEAYDSNSAVKQSRDEVQSELRKLNVLRNLVSPFFTQGQNASSIGVYAPTFKGSAVPSNYELGDKVRSCTTQIQYLDGKFTTVGVPKGHTNIAKQYQILGIVKNLLSKKAFGTTCSQVDSMVTRLITNNEPALADKPTYTRDGVWYLSTLYNENNVDYWTAHGAVKTAITVAKLKDKDGNLVRSPGMLPINKSSQYYDRKGGLDFISFCLWHYLETNGEEIDFNELHLWNKKIRGCYNKLIDYCWNGGLSIFE